MRLPRLMILVVFSAVAFLLTAEAPKKAPEWSMNATAIEACSCPMFCQCYFSSEPASHASHSEHGEVKEHFCKFNMAWRVNRGMHGDTNLAGAKFWIAGDLGGDFSKSQMDWAVLTFDPAVTPAQREGIVTAVGKLFPVKWNSFAVAKDSPIDWEATKQMAAARLDSGKAGEVVLTKGPGMNDESPVIKNLRYWGAPRNDGFVLMPNKVEAYRAGDKPFEFRGTNGFMITIDINSKDTM